jgi:Protein of unknown function (DUF4240)
MTAVLKMNIQELDTRFVENLRHQFAHSEIEIRVHEASAVAQTTLTIKDFWAILATLDWSQESDDMAVIAPVVKLLAERPLAHIYRFADRLAEKLWQLDTKSHAQIFLEDPEEDGYLSVDDFLYARCAVVANGKEFYKKVLQNPSTMPDDLTFESLLYIPVLAYKCKTGKEFVFNTPHNYETYSNKGGWKA